MIEKTRFDLPLVLPEVRDVADRCVERLLTVLRARDGVEDDAAGDAEHDARSVRPPGRGIRHERTLRPSRA